VAKSKKEAWVTVKAGEKMDMLENKKKGAQQGGGAVPRGCREGQGVDMTGGGSVGNTTFVKIKCNRQKSGSKLPLSVLPPGCRKNGGGARQKSN